MDITFSLKVFSESSKYELCLESLGFPDSSVGKESACNAEDPGSIPGSGGFTGESSHSSIPGLA